MATTTIPYVVTGGLGDYADAIDAKYLLTGGLAILTPVTGGVFTLNVSTLGGIQYQTVPFDMQGEFRDLQLHWSQSVSGQDMEPHYLELHFTLAGVDEGL